MTTLPLPNRPGSDLFNEWKDRILGLQQNLSAALREADTLDSRLRGFLHDWHGFDPGESTERNVERLVEEYRLLADDLRQVRRSGS